MKNTNNTIYTFGFLVAALIIAPNAAAFGQNYDVKPMKPTAIITSSDKVNQTDSQSTRESQTRIRSGSLCSSGGQFTNADRGSNRGALVSSSYNRVPQETAQNRVHEVLRSFCN